MTSSLATKACIASTIGVGHRNSGLGERDKMLPFLSPLCSDMHKGSPVCFSKHAMLKVLDSDSLGDRLAAKTVFPVW